MSQVFLVLVAALLAAFDAVVVGLSLGSPDRFSLPWLLASLFLPVVAVTAVAVRRRHLLAAIVVLSLVGVAVTVFFSAPYGAGAPSFSVLFVLALLAMVAVRMLPARSSVAAALIGLAGVSAEALRLGDTIAPIAIVVCTVSYSVAVAVGIYLRWTDWRRVTAESAARSDERLEIARELHDLVGHYLTGMVVQAQAARHVADRDPSAAVEALDRIEAAGAEAMTAMRRMVGALRDDAPTAPGAAWEDIEELVNTAAADGVPARLRMGADVRSLPADLSSSAYRIVTESLTNVRRHARDATRVDIDLERDASLLRIRVADDGAEPPAAGHGTYGLVGMSERADALGGRLYAGPGPNRGWVVLAELPLGHAS